MNREETFKFSFSNGLKKLFKAPFEVEFDEFENFGSEIRSATGFFNFHNGFKLPIIISQNKMVFHYHLINKGASFKYYFNGKEFNISPEFFEDFSDILNDKFKDSVNFWINNVLVINKNSNKKLNINIEIPNNILKEDITIEYFVSHYKNNDINGVDPLSIYSMGQTISVSSKYGNEFDIGNFIENILEAKYCLSSFICKLFSLNLDYFSLDSFYSLDNLLEIKKEHKLINNILVY